MSEISQTMIGAILISMPSILLGGYFLLQIRSGKHAQLELTTFQQAMFRAGHAHAGVLVLLSIIVQPLCDIANLSDSLEWIARLGFPVAGLFVSGGFFGAAAGKGTTKPGALIGILYVGVAILAGSMVLLGVGLLR